MSSSKIMPEADRPRAVDTDSTQPPESFLRHVLKSHSDSKPFDQVQKCAKL